RAAELANHEDFRARAQGKDVYEIAEMLKADDSPLNRQLFKNRAEINTMRRAEKTGALGETGLDIGLEVASDPNIKQSRVNAEKNRFYTTEQDSIKKLQEAEKAAENMETMSMAMESGDRVASLSAAVASGLVNRGNPESSKKALAFIDYANTDEGKEAKIKFNIVTESLKRANASYGKHPEASLYAKEYQEHRDAISAAYSELFDTNNISDDTLTNLAFANDDADKRRIQIDYSKQERETQKKDLKFLMDLQDGVSDGYAK
ncbi:unnamed protein product, partial [marine sediment metagenome]